MPKTPAAPPAEYPPDGPHAAVLIDAWNYDAVDKMTGRTVTKLALRYAVDPRMMQDGQLARILPRRYPYWSVTERFNNTLGKKSYLRGRLNDLVGKAITDEQIRNAGGVDWDRFIGKQYVVNVMTEDTPSGRYCNIKSIALPMPGVQPCPFPVENDGKPYLRMDKRTPAPQQQQAASGSGIPGDPFDEPPAGEPSETAAFGGPDDDIPFDVAPSMLR